MGVIKEKIPVVCEVCGKHELVRPCRAKKYKTCSKECRGARSRKNLSRKKPGVCPVCGIIFMCKPSQIKRKKYCSKQCQAEAYTQRYLGALNPNFKNRYVDQNGYSISHNGKSGPIHIKVVMEALGLECIPKGIVVHHRDCDKGNNSIDNLCPITSNDHMWLHKQFGSAVLWAYMHNHIDLNTLVSWSDTPNRARYLLTLSTTSVAAVYKSGEFSGSLEVGYTEPSSSNEVTVDEKVQRIASEDSTDNLATSARQADYECMVNTLYA